MKFLCVSDQIDPLVYSTSVKERYGDVDAVLCAGDLSMEYVDFIVTTLGKPTFFVFGNHNLNDFHYYNKSVSLSRPSTPADEISQMKHGHGGDYVSNRIIRSKHLKFTDRNGKSTPLLICGVSGSIKYNNGLAQYTESQMKRQLLHLIPGLLWNKIRWGRYCDIFLTHASPRHIHDREDPCHIGFECFNWFIKKFQPALMVHGHIHLYDLQAQRVTETGSTTVVNAYSHIVLELSPEETSDQGEKFELKLSVLSDR